MFLRSLHLLRSLPDREKGKQGKKTSTCPPERNENVRRPLASKTVLLLDDLLVAKIQSLSAILRITYKYDQDARCSPDVRSGAK